MNDWEQRWRDLAKRHREVVLQSETLVARLVEVEQALRDNVDALVWALGEVRAWADDEVNETDYQRACEANSAARAVLDKGEQPCPPA